MERIPDHSETAELCARSQAGEEASQRLLEPGVGRTERRRLERLVADGREAEATLVIGHARLINYLTSGVIRAIGVTEVSYEDLYQEAAIGFILAVRRYDPSQGSLSNYATWRVRDQIQSFVRGNSGLSGKTGGTLLVSLRRYIPLLEEKLGRHPTAAELTEIYNETTLLRYSAIAASKPGGANLDASQLRAEGMKQMKRRGVWLTEERVDALLRSQMAQTSLDAPVYRDESDGDSEASYLDGGRDTEQEATDRLEAEELAHDVGVALQQLTTKHGADVADVVRLRFGLGSGEPMSVNEISDTLDLSAAKVRKLLNTGLGELRGLLSSLEGL